MWCLLYLTVLASTWLVYLILPLCATTLLCMTIRARYFYFHLLTSLRCSYSDQVCHYVYFFLFLALILLNVLACWP